MKALQALNQAHFDAVRLYINTGASDALNDQTKKLLEACVRCFGILRLTPSRHEAVKRLRALYSDQGLSESSALRIVDLCRHSWGWYSDYSKDFLQAFLLEHLMNEIANPQASEAMRARNLATLQKHIEALPDATVDPRLMEQNTINIQFNIGSQTVTLTPDLLAALPETTRQQLLAATTAPDLTTSDAAHLLT